MDPDHVSQSQLDGFSVTERVCSVFSLLGCLFIISTFTASKSFHKPINRLVFYASFGNMMTNVATLMARTYIDSTTSPGCQFQAFLIQMFMPADALWTLAMAINVYLTFYYKFDAQKLRRMELPYLIFCYGVPLAVALAYVFIETPERGRMYGNATLWCWVSPNWDIWRIATFYGPVWVVILITFFIYIRAGREIYKRHKQLRDFRYSSYHEPEPLPPMDDLQNSSKTTEVYVTTEILTRQPSTAGRDGGGGYDSSSSSSSNSNSIALDPTSHGHPRHNPGREEEDGTVVIDLAPLGRRPRPRSPLRDHLDVPAVPAVPAVSSKVSPSVSNTAAVYSVTISSDRRPEDQNANPAATPLAAVPALSSSTAATTTTATRDVPTPSSSRPARIPRTPRIPGIPRVPRVSRIFIPSSYSAASPAATTASSTAHLVPAPLPVPTTPRNPASQRQRRRAVYEANSAAWSYAKCALLFFTALLVTWIPSSANRVFSVVHVDAVSVPLEYMSAFVLPLQGFWNAIIYVVTSWKACQQLWDDLLSGLWWRQQQLKQRLQSVSRKQEEESGRLGRGPGAVHYSSHHHHNHDAYAYGVEGEISTARAHPRTDGQDSDNGSGSRSSQRGLAFGPGNGLGNGRSSRSEKTLETESVRELAMSRTASRETER